MKLPIDIEGIYHDYIEQENDKNVQERYQDKKKYYHISAIDMCSRKLYYESVMQLKPMDKPNKKSSRIMRLGTVVHEDIQNALTVYSNTVYSNTENSKEKNQVQKEINIEGEVIIEDLNIRGFYDFVYNKNGVYLFDFKTIGSYPYKLKFGRNQYADKNYHHEMQIASYGIGVQEEFGRLDGMYLCYYNKDTSVLKTISVSLSFVEQARRYWEEINQEHELGLPQFRLGVSPKAEWVCNYCSFASQCGSPYKK